MDLSWLKSFLALARTRNFASAARQNNVTQPAFSRRIRALETWVGTDLIDRSTYPTTLTPAGERFLRVADDVNRQLLEVRAELADIGAGDRPKLVLAAQHTLAMTYLPDLVWQLETVEPRLQTVVHAENIHDCVDRLLAGNADMLVAYALPQAPLHFDGGQVQSVWLGTDSLVPVASPDATGEPLFNLKSSGDQVLPWLSYGAEAMIEHGVVDLVERRGVRLDPVVRNPVTEVLRRFALKGIGIAWLPESLIAADLRTASLVVAGDASWRIDLKIHGYRLTRAANPMLDTVWSRLPL